MEVAIANNTTNTNNNQHHSISGVRSPFQREVREWQRIDPSTGALLTGRLEADRWINGPLHSYGKKSNSSVSSNSNSSMANIQNFTNNNNNNNNNNNTNTNNNKSTNGSGSKLSLHAIVGSTNSSNSSNTAALLSTSSSTKTFNSTTATTNTAWQRQQPKQQQHQQQQRNSRLFEQLPTFGKINSTSSGCGSGFTKSRVGGAVADDSAEAEFDGRVTFNSTATDERSTLQLTPTHLHRRDLESFRHSNDHHHYHNDDRGGVVHHNENVDFEDNDADLRLSSRHQRRQQIPISSSSLLSPSLQRGRSISTDDLSTEWDPHGDQAMLDEPSEWKRVSKLRRSFQSPATTRTTPSESYNSAAPRRPLDLPTSTVSVSKIRAELENGRRLNTAMRNNHVDMEALQSILNSSTCSSVESKPVATQRTSFLTAESLKEIRNKLKKLSDESLYKEDFVVHQLPPLEHLEIREIKTKPVLKTQLRQLTPERSPEISPLAPSAFRLVAKHKPASPPVLVYNVSPKQHTTNSLESRQKYRDTSSAEWHLRRKSYGFEKMVPPEENTMFSMDASTDSGLGRSGELNAWSPTEAVPAARSTVVHFGESARVTGLLQRRYQHQLNSPEAGSSSDEQKRHSIAFDDSQYVRKTSQVRLNGGIGGNDETESTQPQHYDTDSPTNATSSTQFYQRSQQKRVEFCKTEVHFAAESGRVNIVETDGKPPPTNNFRRRRRTTSGPLQSLVKGASTSEAITPAANSNIALPITRFGDENRPRTIATTTVAYKASLVESSADAFEPSSVTISLPKVKDGYLAGSRNSYASTSGIDTTDNENDDIAAIRGILKNKPIKPKPYHLGENFESPDALWGVQLKPVSAHPTQQLQTADMETGTKPDSPSLQAISKSVAERVHNVEKRQDSSALAQYGNSYSTKINLSLGENSTDWKEQELPKSNIMSIALHSPQASLEKLQPQPTPVARPRTTTVQATDSAAKEPLRIIKEARGGARKLREHELSFFGVPVANSKTTNNTAMQQPTTTSKRTLPQRHRLREDTTRTLNEEEHNEAQSSKWKLTNDRPDLLHHTEHSSKGTQENQTKKKSFSPVKRIQYSDEEEDAESENFYENLTNELNPTPLKTQTMQTAKAYSRQRDLERDEKILSEMTHTADQTMKALSDEAVLKNQRRRSLTRRNSKPLETIDEKTITERISDKCIAVKVTRSTLASEAKRQTARQPTHSPTARTMSRTRTSSQSSVESCSRGRSRSLSSEREYEQTSTKPSTRSTTKHTRHTKPTSRSSSRDSQRSSQTHGSSGDELCRRDERLRTKTKRSSNAILSKTQSEKLRHKDYERKDRDKTGERSQQPHARSLRATPAQRDSSAKSKSTSTTRSSQRECVECVTDATHAPQHSSSRRHRSEIEKRNSSNRSAVAGDKIDSRSGSRLVRSARSSQDYDSSQRSSNRSERSGTDREKLSRSRGHSSRSATHSNESKHHSQQHTSSPSGTKMRHNSEQRKSTSATGTSTTADNSQTHSKNAQALNGISSQRQQHHHHLHPTQHVHSLTAATIATKQRERSGKDRK